MLDTIRSPLRFHNFAENGRALIEKFVDDPVLRRFFQGFESML